MDTLIKLTKDVWQFGCKGDVIRVSEERLKALEAQATKLGQSVYVQVKEAVTAAERAATAAEADVVAAAPKVAKAAKAAKAAAETVVSDLEGKK